MKDALGKDIVMGGLYGYSRASSGINTVYVGRAEKATPKGLLTMRVVYYASGIYNELSEETHPDTKVTVKPVMLFPVNESEFFHK